MRPGLSPAAFVVAGALLLLLLPGVGGHASVPPASPHLPALGRIGPWDPLLGDPALGVPRYRVTGEDLARPGAALGVAGVPVWLAYDPSDSAFWVAQLPDTVAVVPQGNSTTVAGTVAVGSTPFGVAVDPVADRVFVTNTGSDNVTVIDGATELSTQSVGVGVQPMGVAYDGVDHRLYVANFASDNVTVLSTSNWSVVANIAVGERPVGLLDDPASGRVFVADSGSNDVTVIATATDTVVAHRTAGVGSYGLALDNVTDNVYVTNPGSSNVTVFHAPSGAPVANIPVLTPWGTELQGIAFDYRSGQLWVGGGFAYLVVLNASAEAVAYLFTSDPSGVAYDPDTGTICYTNTWNASFRCVTAVVGLNNSAPIDFTESGLPPGTPWSVDQAGGPSSNSTTSTVQFWSCAAWSACGWAADYRFVVPPVPGYVPNRTSVDLGAANLPATVLLTFSPSAGTYPVRFLESGLPGGVSWGVRINGSSRLSGSPTLTDLAVNGSVLFTVTPIPGYQSNVSRGNITVVGRGVDVSIGFTPCLNPLRVDETGLGNSSAAGWYFNITSGPPGANLTPIGPLEANGVVVVLLPNGTYTYDSGTNDSSFVAPSVGSFFEFGGSPYSITLAFSPVNYSIQFHEVGLPNGTAWSVYVWTGDVNGTPAGSSSNVILVPEPVGVYQFRVTAVPGFNGSPSSGSVPVIGTGPDLVDIAFTSSWEFAIHFQETGLPSGRGWSLAIGSDFESSLGPTITFVEPNGTYGYVIQSVSGYVTNFSGTVTVRGANQSVAVTFSPQTYPIVVIEVGLPVGTGWNVTITSTAPPFNETIGTHGDAIILYLPNGTYTLSVQIPPGYNASLSSPTITVAGSVNGPTVSFTPTPSRIVPPPLRTPFTVFVGDWIALAAVVGVLVGVVAVRFWTRPRPPPPVREGR